MLGLTWKVIPGFRHGDWRAKLIGVAQVCVGIVAVLGSVSMATLSPFWLLGFIAAQGLLVVGVILFVVVVLFAQRTLIEEEFGPGEIVFNEGEPGRHLYVIKAGTVQVLVKAPDGAQRLVNELGPGDHFGEMALLGNVPRNATIRTVTRVQALKMARGSFAALYTSLPGFNEQFNRVMEARLKELRTR
jgi:hypothetical protein